MNSMTTQEEYLDIDKVIDIIIELNDVLDHENELLNNMQITEISYLHDKKVQLIEELEKYKKIMNKNHHIIKQLPPHKTLKFNLLNKKFNDAMENNLNNLSKARAANSKIVEVFKNVVTEQAQEKSNYNKDGKYLSDNKQNKFNSIILNDKI